NPQSRGAPGPLWCRTGSACIPVSQTPRSPASDFVEGAAPRLGARAANVRTAKSDPARSGGELTARGADVLALGPADRGSEASVEESSLEGEDALGRRPSEA